MEAWSNMADSKKATGSFKVANWDEGPFAEHEGAPKLTAARVTATYTGDIEGEGTSQSVMAYLNGAEYNGFERIVGSIAGRPGSFVLRSAGTWENGVAKTRWTVVPGSGTGELEGLRGEGGYDATDQSEVRYTLDYRFG
jgi:Protein of unknown function (DUF3224)